MTAFRASNEECQIIVKSEPLKEAIQGMFCQASLFANNGNAIAIVLELADSQWLDAVTIEINPDPAYWKARTL